MLFVTLCVLSGLAALAPEEALAERVKDYRIEVDIANQIVTVYRKADQAIIRQMVCSSGRNNRTPRGNFRLYTRKSTDRKEWYHICPKWYVKYATRITGPYLFHSVPFTKPKMSALVRSQYKLLGSVASAGCVRLHWDDAKWISDNCADGTKVRIFTGAAKNRPLKSALMLSRYSIDSGLSYEDFLASNYISTEPGTLGRGSNGAQVLALKKRLIGLGFLSGGVDDSYDNAAIAAIIRYQTAVGIEPTGLTTPALYDRIMADETHIGGGSTLESGVNGPIVRRLQAVLRDLGIYNGAVDGIYGDAVADAVNILSIYNGAGGTRKATPELQAAAQALLDDLNARFGEGGFSTVLHTETLRNVTMKSTQKLYKSASTSAKVLAQIKKGKAVTLLSENGKWSRISYSRYTGYVRSSALKSTNTTRVTLYWGINVEVLGERTLNADCIGPAVRRLQERLAELGFLTEESSGRYSDATADAVRAYQSEAGLAVTGEANTELQRAVLAQDACTGTAVEQKRGMAGPVVAALQRTLKALQYYDGDCGGHYDDATAEAVKLFTRTNGFPESDVATPEVQQAVRRQFRECEATYGSGNYTLTITEVSSEMAKLKKAESLYKSASTKAAKLKSAPKGAVIDVISRDGAWSNVIYQGVSGYMRNSRLRFYTHIDYVAEFISPQSDEVPSDEAPAEESPEDEADAGDEWDLDEATDDEVAGLDIIYEDVAEDMTAFTLEDSEDSDAPDAPDGLEPSGEGGATGDEAPVEPTEAAVSVTGASAADDLRNPGDGEADG